MTSALYKTRCINGKGVLITGASAGIGRSCALMFAEQQSRLILVARRRERLEEVRREINVLFPDCDVRIEVCDVSNIKEVTNLCERLKGTEIDILVNNAGLAVGVEPGDQVSLEDVDVMINTNVKGVIALVHGLVPQMRRRNAGDIVNISSVAAFDRYSGGSIYCATKAAVDAFTDCLRMDLVDTDIRVIGIYPGLVSGTEFSVVRFKGDEEKAKSPYVGIDCLSPIDIADQVLYSVTRPLNVQISQIRSYCNQQAHAKYVMSRKAL
jgi:3-hydroxy acid dehydrogenase/malonic semialdehyde reductase